MPVADIFLNTNPPYPPEDVLLRPSKIVTRGGVNRPPHHRQVPAKPVPVVVRRRAHTTIELTESHSAVLHLAAHSSLLVTGSESSTLHVLAATAQHVTHSHRSTLRTGQHTALTVHDTAETRVNDNPDDLLMLLLAAAT